MIQSSRDRVVAKGRKGYRMGKEMPLDVIC
jgi:hypothetical protein